MILTNNKSNSFSYQIVLNITINKAKTKIKVEIKLFRKEIFLELMRKKVSGLANGIVSGRENGLVTMKMIRLSFIKF
jgi:hypothetical protein